MREGRAGHFASSIWIGFGRGNISAGVVGVRGGGIGLLVVDADKLIPLFFIAVNVIFVCIN